MLMLVSLCVSGTVDLECVDNVWACKLIWLLAPYSSFMFSSCDFHLGRDFDIGQHKHIQLPGGACFVTIHKQHVSLGVYNQMFPVEPCLISTSTNLSFWCCDSRSDQGLFILHWNNLKLYHCMFLICV